eukprot:596810-Rhodomonas_salina.1
MFTKASVDNILSLALLKKQGYKVDFAKGTDNDPTFGGTIVTPSGDTIHMVFDNNMYCLPLPETAEKDRAKKAKTAETEHPLLSRPLVLPSLL